MLIEVFLFTSSSFERAIEDIGRGSTRRGHRSSVERRFVQRSVLEKKAGNGDDSPRGEEHKVCDAFHDQPRCSRANTCLLNRATRPSFYFADYHNHSHEWDIYYIYLLYTCSTRKWRNEFRKIIFKIPFFFFFIRPHIETFQKEKKEKNPLREHRFEDPHQHIMVTVYDGYQKKFNMIISRGII